MRHDRAIAIIFLVGFSAAMGVDSAWASSILFQGQNAALFPNANPADQSILLESVQRPVNPASVATGQITPAALIEQSVESQISADIYNQIFNTSNPSGSFDLGGGNTIGFIRSGGNIIINITDPAHGSTTITLPDL